MRATLLASEYLTFIPPLILLLRRLMYPQTIDPWKRYLVLVAVLLQPGLILIDHGHFQYNTVMLGLVAASLSNISIEKKLWASAFFVAALGFKQMALYYAPAIFACLLGACLTPRLDLLSLIRIAVVTLLSLAVLYTPIVLGGLWHGALLDDQGAVLVVDPPLLTSIPFAPQILHNHYAWYYPAVQQVAQSVHRIFPFARGIFEDKVANLWCTLNVIVKLRHYPNSVLQRASLIATLTSVTPPCVALFLRPRSNTLLYGFAATAWGFFLCSFQVHEKSVLLPLLPMTLALGLRGGMAANVRAWVGLANVLGAWTMYPLLKRDQLRTPYLVVTLLWIYLLGLPPISLSAYMKKRRDGSKYVPATIQLHLAMYGIMIAWHLGEAWITPPEGKPDLWVVLNAAIGFAGFGLCYLWSVWQTLNKARLLQWGKTDTGSGEK